MNSMEGMVPMSESRLKRNSMLSDLDSELDQYNTHKSSPHKTLADRLKKSSKSSKKQKKNKNKSRKG